MIQSRPTYIRKTFFEDRRSVASWWIVDFCTCALSALEIALALTAIKSIVNDCQVCVGKSAMTADRHSWSVWQQLGGVHAKGSDPTNQSISWMTWSDSIFELSLIVWTLATYQYHMGIRQHMKYTFFCTSTMLASSWSYYIHTDTPTVHGSFSTWALAHLYTLNIRPSDTSFISLMQCYAYRQVLSIWWSKPKRDWKWDMPATHIPENLCSEIET